ncbi:MAG: hypothetical protein WDO16_26175 [Bacteroidota bacterium]
MPGSYAAFSAMAGYSIILKALYDEKDFFYPLFLFCLVLFNGIGADFC